MNGGLSIDWAGKSLSSQGLPNRTDAERDDFWSRKQQWMEDNTGLTANSKIEVDRRRALYKAEFEKEIAAVKARTAKLDQKIDDAMSLFDRAEAAIKVIETSGGQLTPEEEQMKEAIALGRAFAKR
ncbi:hypothetical protein G6011_02819 [Alternaria panax]|uniref:Uncharacterized protein n=1 Tax=Alternaria panax TaxID=48097 RepID=A0AAD4FAB4_9PLEO|nr:hypothetical protein G6011_02819 [Alternaria panax]